MQKFTVFTVILTILVVVVAAETFVSKYLPALTGSDVSTEEEAGGDQYNLPSELDLSAAVQTNVLGAGGGALDYTAPALPAEPAGSITPDNFDFLEFDSPPPDTPLMPDSDTAYFDIEEFSSSFDHSVTNVFIRDDQITNSGFVGAYLETEAIDGLLYKTINVGDLYGVQFDKYAVTNGTTTFAKTYIIVPDDPLGIEDIYDLLKLRASEGLEVEINETNDYGSASFYMNDLRRENAAFLTVRIGSRIYGFSYPKQYHPQIKNLVSVLMLDGR
jgi:hypothetical protein